MAPVRLLGGVLPCARALEAKPRAAAGSGPRERLNWVPRHSAQVHLEVAVVGRDRVPRRLMGAATAEKKDFIAAAEVR